MNFPVYRKYPNGKTFFRIISREEFQELKIVGKKYSISAFKAKIFSDHLLIRDMLELTNGHWEESNHDEYEKVLLHCQHHLEKL